MILPFAGVVNVSKMSPKIRFMFNPPSMSRKVTEVALPESEQPTMPEQHYQMEILLMIYIYMYIYYINIIYILYIYIIYILYIYYIYIIYILYIYIYHIYIFIYIHIHLQLQFSIGIFTCMITSLSFILPTLPKLPTLVSACTTEVITMVPSKAVTGFLKYLGGRQAWW